MTAVRTRPEIAGPDRPTHLAQHARDRLMTFVIVAAWAFAILPRAIQSLTAPKYRVDIGGTAIPYSALAHRTVTVVTLAIFLACLLPVILTLRDIRTTGKIALTAYLLPWVYMVFRGLYQGQHIHKAQYVYPLIGIAVWALRPRWKSLSVLGYLAGATALLAVFMGLVMPAKGLYQAAGGTDITADKQIFSSGILVGPLTNGNNLGQFLVMGAACALMIKNQYWRVVMIGACGLGLVWSSARSSIGAYLAVGIVLLIIRFTPGKARGAVAFAILAGLVALVVELPLTTTDPLAFTNRGYIWQVSLQAWDRHQWIGLGANFYQQIAAQSSTLGGSVFHGHNEFVQLLVTGGRFLALLIGFLMVVAILNAARWARVGEFFPLLFLTALIGACVLEVSFALIDRDFLVPVMIVPLAFVMMAEPPPRRSAAADPPEPARPARPAQVGVGTDRRRPVGAGALSASAVRRSAPSRSVGLTDV